MSTLPWQDFGCRKSFISPTPRSFHWLESLSKRYSLARSQNSTSKPSSPVTIWISSGRAMIGSKWSLSSSWPSTSSLVSANNCIPAPWNGLKLSFFWVTEKASSSLGFRGENVSWPTLSDVVGWIGTDFTGVVTTFPLPDWNCTNFSRFAEPEEVNGLVSAHGNRQGELLIFFRNGSSVWEELATDWKDNDSVLEEPNRNFFSLFSNGSLVSCLASATCGPFRSPSSSPVPLSSFCDGNSCELRPAEPFLGVRLSTSGAWLCSLWSWFKTKSVTQMS